MIVRKSPLDLQDFIIVNNTFNFISPKDEVDLDELFDRYIIDIDYAINSKNELDFQLLVKVEINLNKESDGYSFKGEGMGYFSFDNEVTKEDKVSFLNYSGLPMCINSMRSFISTLTSHGPLGKFTLPSIDLNDLIDQKKAKIKSIREQKKMAGKSSDS